MFVTFEDFFNNYRIKNEMAPNETTLNVGLLRLKRELRELKSLFDIIINNPIETWNQNKIYETDEYVSYNDNIYKSKVDTNIGVNPQNSEDFWELVSLPTIKLNPDTTFHYQKYTAIQDQHIFILDYDIVGNPCVFVDGLLIDRDLYTYTDKQITFNDPLNAGQQVVIIHGIAYEPGIILPTEEMTATEGQFDFNTDFDLISPNVFVNGILISEKDFTYGKNYISLENPTKEGDIVVIANGASVGMKDFYTKDEITNILNDYYTKDLIYTKDEVQRELDKLEDSIYQDSNIVKLDIVYTKEQVDNLLGPKANIEYVDEQLEYKADKANTLDGYGITNAYVKHEVDALLLDKLDSSEFNYNNIIQLLKSSPNNVPISVNSIGNLTAEMIFDKTQYQDVQGGIGLSSMTNDGYVEFSFDNEKLPFLYMARRDGEFNEVSGRIYGALNSKDLILNIEGDFKGTFWINLYNLGVVNPDDYNWNVIVEPTTIPRLLKHDFVPLEYGFGYNFKGFYENTEIQASHFYGFVKNNILKCYAYAEIASTSMREWQAHYKLIGYHKSISTNIYYNQNDEKIDYIRYPFITKDDFNNIVSNIADDMTITPSAPDILQNNSLQYTDTVTTEEMSTDLYQSNKKGTFTPTIKCNVQQINNNGEAIIYVVNGLPNSDINPVIEGDGEFDTITYNFDDYGEAQLIVIGKSPFTAQVTVTITGSMIEPCSIIIPITPSI